MSFFRARHLVAVLILVSLSSFLVPAQQQKQSPEEKPRNIKQEPNKAYKQWVNDHDLILTQSERDEWKKLATYDERD